MKPEEMIPGQYYVVDLNPGGCEWIILFSYIKDSNVYDKYCKSRETGRLFFDGENHLCPTKNVRDVRLATAAEIEELESKNPNRAKNTQLYEIC